MSLAITHLGTGSSGNSTLLETDDCRILIDQGFSGVELERRLGRIGIRPEKIDAIVISHHHSDHGGGAAIANKRWGIPIHCNIRTAKELGLRTEQIIPFESLDLLSFGEHLSILPVPVPHDGSENVGFIASHAGKRAAIVTDLGSWTDELISHLKGCTHISIEANYDHNRLINGPYAMSLKERISGRGGHLSNDQTGQLLAKVVDSKTRTIVLTHLSSENNRPHLAESTVLYHIGDVFEGDIRICGQDGPEFTHIILADAELEAICTP